VGGGWRRPSPEVGGGLFIWLLDLLIGILISFLVCAFF
jgi:hypothetical protein